MRHKKKSETEKTPEQQALEKHVDAMMDPKLPDAPEAVKVSPTAEKSRPEIKAVAVPVAAGPTTAPQLSSKLRKQIADTSAKPLSIDKLDELTEQITKSDSPKATKNPPEKAQEPPVETEEAAAEEDPTEQSIELDDARTDEAVDAIVAYEGDVMLAVADATAEERNRQSAEEKPKGHPVFSMLVWTLVAIVAVIIVALGSLLFMGDRLADKLGL